MNHRIYKITLAFCLLTFSIFLSCKKKVDDGAATPDTSCYSDIALTSFADDLELGRRIDSQIVYTPAEFKILPKEQFLVAYGHLERITNLIKNSGKIANKDKLSWEVKIIHNDSTLNAFCTPGGYIYVYSGIIKYLDNEDDFAGVLGHEIAHADLRHSAKAMTRQYGLDLLISIVLGKNANSQLAQIASGLSSLSYSRCHETQADENSVGYLSGTSYKCNGAASFFQKIVDGGGPKQPQFLSTHPDPGNRVAKINARAVTLGCQTTIPYSDAKYQAFKNSLPK